MESMNGKGKFYWDSEVKNIDEAISWILDCIAEYQSDRKAVEYFKAEYDRLAERRAEAVRDWLAIW